MLTILESQIEYVESLGSFTCPFCKGSKKDGHTFCNSCYWKLPKVHQVAIYRRLGDGYEEAVDDAIEYLRSRRIVVKAVQQPELF